MSYTVQKLTGEVPVSTIGNADLLIRSLPALFCSNRCPASLILQAHDLAHQFVAQGTPIISGFHTPVEKEMLTVLLRGKQPLVYCPARSIDTWRIPKELHKPIEQGRMLILSPFPANQVRMTADLAEMRNQVVARLATQVLVIYAAPGSKTEAQCAELVATGKIVNTLQNPHTAHLLARGVPSLSFEALLHQLSNSTA